MNRRATIMMAATLALAACGGGEPAREPAANAGLADNDDEIIVPQEPASPSNAANADAVRFPLLNLAPDGVMMVLEGGSARHATFGMAREPVLTMAGSALGAPIETGDNQECGGGPLAFAAFRGGLTLYFQDGSFAGWDQDGGEGTRLTTAAGIGIGSTRRELESANAIDVHDSSLGIEFTSGDMAGLLSSRAPEGEITNLWAGATCIAR